MNLRIGSKIRELRVAKGITQEGLATLLGVSSQAISKWENGNTYPDITLLPQIAIYFGISIDDLFQLTEENHMQRIENRIENERMLSDSDFIDCEKFLKDQLAVKEDNGKALTLLADLYNHRADGYHALASNYAKEALEVEPEKKENHRALCFSKRGPISDWNRDNHHELIDYYYEFMKKHPNYWQGYQWLLDNLIDDGRLEEASDVLVKMKKLHNSFRVDHYQGSIFYKQGKLEESMGVWNAMVEKYEDNWLVFFVMADSMARAGQYEEAIKYYRKAYNTQEHPKYTDSLEALSHILGITGKYEEAIKVNEEIITLIKEDWNIVTGELVDYFKRSMERLRKH